MALRSYAENDAQRPLLEVKADTHVGVRQPPAPLPAAFRLTARSFGSNCNRSPKVPAATPRSYGRSRNRDQHDGQSASNRSGTCGHRERQIPTASDIEGPTDLDWVSLCFETEISRCALDSLHGQGALELSASRPCLSKCGEPSSGVTTLRCNPRDRVSPRRPRASVGGSIAADPSDDDPQRHGQGIDNRRASCRTQ